MSRITWNPDPTRWGWYLAFPSPTKTWRTIIWLSPEHGMTAFVAQLGQEYQVGHFRIRSLSGDLRFKFSFHLFWSRFWLLASSDWYNPSFGCFTDEEHTTPRISLVNVQALNYLLRFEIFVSEDGQLQAAHLILDYKPLSCAFVDVGQAIRVGSPWLARIDISKSGFLARKDLPPVQPPTQCVPQEVAVLGEGIDSSHSSLEAEIDHFHFNEESEVSTRPVELLDSGSDLDHFSAAHSPGLVVARIDTSQEIEELLGDNTNVLAQEFKASTI